MKKWLKRISLGLLSFLLAVILVATVVLGWYFPRYLLKNQPVTISPSEKTVTAMSCNVRCLHPADLGKKSWFYRADLMVQDIAQVAPGIIGFQEVTGVHYDYLVDRLPQYDSVIDYRDNSPLSEGCPIFYHTDLYTLVDKGSFWLSKTPEMMSKDWGAAHYRICSYVILKNNADGKEFVVFNTHLDHVSDEARINGIQVVLEKIAQFGGLPSIIMGDFNALEGSKTYQSVTEHFLDAQHAANHSVSTHTYQNWGNPDSFKRLDYFMISKEGILPLAYRVQSAVVDGEYYSDHCPIVLDFLLD